ncbi:UNVERIFIED_CONTAM: hypothetical protein Sradi_5417300 [Sesamum radiatum]|uniref:Uncharacterized protein n=1 Tax=Sesamum radiatum TaxID=300843 RepID=A0AAW2L842_SESRA
MEDFRKIEKNAADCRCLPDGWQTCTGSARPLVGERRRSARAPAAGRLGPLAI